MGELLDLKRTEPLIQLLECNISVIEERTLIFLKLLFGGLRNLLNGALNLLRVIVLSPLNLRLFVFIFIFLLLLRREESAVNTEHGSSHLLGLASESHETSLSLRTELIQDYVFVLHLDRN